MRFKNDKQRKAVMANLSKRKSRSKYYRIRVEDPKKFKKFRTQDFGRKGHTLRIAGKTDGKWKTQAYRVEKDDAYVKGKKLVGRDAKTKKTLAGIEYRHGEIKKKNGDFKAG